MQSESKNQTKEKRKLKGWRATVGGGYDHQFFRAKDLDDLAAKEEQWVNFLKAKQEC